MKKMFLICALVLAMLVTFVGCEYHQLDENGNPVVQEEPKSGN